MKSILTLTLLMSVFISSAALAQRVSQVDERIQTTYVNKRNVDLAQWLRVHPTDVFDTEIRNLNILAASFITNKGSIDIFVNNRLFRKLSYKRLPSQQNVNFPLGTRLHQITVHIDGEVYVDSITAHIIERRFQPRPVPPRYPAPAPRPVPPRHPAPAPRPAPPRHEPAPRPTPPRHEPAPRPTPPRHEPAPRPGQPRPGQGPAPRPGQGPRR